MIDIEYDDDFNLVFRNGDLSLFNGDKQNAGMIIISGCGELKRSPNLFVGINSYLNSQKELNARQTIIKKLESDGFQIINLDIIQNNDDIDIKLNAKRIK